MLRCLLPCSGHDFCYSHDEKSRKAYEVQQLHGNPVLAIVHRHVTMQELPAVMQCV